MIRTTNVLDAAPRTLPGAVRATPSMLVSPFATVPPLLDYCFLAHPTDLERTRPAVRLAMQVAASVAFQEIITTRIVPPDADLASAAARGCWRLAPVSTAHH